MALYFGKTINACPAALIKLLSFYKFQPHFHLFFLHQSTTEGALDEFTSKLIQRNTSKWKKKQILAHNNDTNLKHNFMKIRISEDIENLDMNTLNELFENAIECDDVTAIIGLTKQCTHYNKIPSLKVLLSALSVCARLGHRDIIVDISNLCERVRPELLKENSFFEHYIAEALWMNGDITKSLSIFEKVYRENAYLRRKIRTIMKYLIKNCIRNHSQATLVNLLQFSEKLVNEYNDYFTLGCIWQACILSEWFADQQIAIDYLLKYQGLCNVIINKVPFVVKMSLKQHRTEIVYRLMEVLLQYEMKSEISQVLLVLIDYFIKEGQFRQCREIIVWSIEHDIQIVGISGNHKLMNMLAKDVQDKIKVKVTKQTPSDYHF
ncbi:hypothetical protein ABEB36_002350 [Hypothenemus hampei]|uniref:Uncharacterized protein n=1 Tax=Hypothenemus hampei TaxID=57062 RepID=A0ABD1F5H2_HYPHA